MTWRRFYGPYMRLMNDYKNMGGLVTAGSDPGFIYQTWGFSYIGELEMLQEAGFSPLEVIAGGDINGARTLYEPKGVEPPIGLVEVGQARGSRHRSGKPAGRISRRSTAPGFERLGPDGKVQRVGGVR